MSDLEAGYDDYDSEDEYLADSMAQQADLNAQQEERSAGQMQSTNQDFRMGIVPHHADSEGVAPMQLREGYDPQGRRVTQNTGPKGVKADYEEAKGHMQDRRMMNQMRQDRDLANLANPTDLSGFKEHVNHRPNAKNMLKKKDNGSDSDSSSDLSDMDSEDEDFQKYKLERIKAAESSIPTFGSHERLMTKRDLAFAIKSMHGLCFCIVHIYENNIPACTALNLVMESLAPQFPHIRFCRVRAADSLGAAAKRNSLPTLMVYKGPQPFKNYVRFPAYVNGEIRDLRVAQFLASEGVLRLPTADLLKNTKLDRSEDAERGENILGSSARITRAKAFDSEDEDY